MERSPKLSIVQLFSLIQINRFLVGPISAPNFVALIQFSSVQFSLVKFAKQNDDNDNEKDNRLFKER